MTTNQDWVRLGRLLTARRIALGYPVRSKFAQARKQSHSRTISDIENAKRTNFEPGTLALIEQLYGWGTGSIDAVLKGGEPTVLHRGVDDAQALLADSDALADGDPADQAFALSYARHPAARLSLVEATTARTAVARALQDAMEELSYAQHRLEHARRVVEAAEESRVALQHEQSRLDDLIAKMQKKETPDVQSRPAPITQAEGSSATDVVDDDEEIIIDPEREQQQPRGDRRGQASGPQG